MTYLVFLIIWLLMNCMMYTFHQSEKQILIANGVFLVLIAALRGIHIGPDVENYGRLFVKYAKEPWFYANAITGEDYYGYKALCKIVYYMSGGSYQCMLFVSATIIIYGFFKFIYRYSPNALASSFYFVTIFYYFETFNTTRQWIAIAIGLLALLALEDCKYIKSIVLIIFAVSIHNTAVFTLVPYIIFTRIKWNKRLFCIYSITVVAIMQTVSYMIQIFVRFFPRYTRYTYVLSQGVMMEGFGGIVRGRRRILSIIFLLFIILAFLFLSETVLSQKKDQKSNKKNIFWISAAMTMIEIIIGIIFYNNMFYMRIQGYFSFFTILLLPLIIEKIRGKGVRFLVYVCTNGAFLFSTIVRLTGERVMYPYQFFWQN